MLKRKRFDDDDAATDAGAAADAKGCSNGGEETALCHLLSRRVQSSKEVEGVDGSSSTIERPLPSFWDFYPRAKRAQAALAGDRLGRLRLLCASEKVLSTGDTKAMGREVTMALGNALGGTSPDDAIVLDDDDDDDDDDEAPGHQGRRSGETADLQWQCDGGDAGWLDFNPAANAAAETARQSGLDHTFFHSHGFKYKLDLNFMIQANLETGYVRPVRYVA